MASTHYRCPDCGSDQVYLFGTTYWTAGIDRIGGLPRKASDADESDCVVEGAACTDCHAWGLPIDELVPNKEVSA